MPPEPNRLLRQARERLRSPGQPDSVMSRGELAEAVNSWIFEHHGKVVELDSNYIGKLERGQIRWPQARYREALRAVLRTDADARLGFSGRRHRSSAVAFVDRTQFLHGPDSSASLPWSELFSPIEPTPIPARVGRTDVEHVRAASAAFMSWDNAHGGGLAREAVFAQLRWSAQLLHADCPAAVRPALFAAVAEFAGVAAFMAFDAYAHDDARRTFRFGLRCAEESGDWHLRASILSMLARQAVWCGDPDTGLTYVETALVRNDRLTATERAQLHTLRARALAKLARTRDCLLAVGAADDAFTEARPEEDPPWMAFYDDAQHRGDTAHALFDLSVRGTPTEAARRLNFAVRNHGAEYGRSRTISRTKLASLLMVTGDPLEAVAVGEAALDGIAYLRSRRAVDDLRELYGYAGRHLAIPEVATLRERLRATASIG